MDQAPATSEPRSASLLRPTLGLATIVLVVRGLGFVEKQVLAYEYGLDARVDAYLVAVGVPLAIFIFTRELVEPAFLPVFVRGLSDQRRANQLFTFHLLSVLGASSFLAGLAFWGARPLSSWMAPGFGPGALDTTVELLRWMTPAAVLLALSTLTAITLNAHQSFLRPASGDILLKLLPLVVFVCFMKTLGILALSLGFVVGAAARLFWHASGLRGRVALTRPSLEYRHEIGETARLMAPLVLGVVFSEVSAKADNYFASLVGEGGVASKSYAQKIADLPVMMVAYTLSVVLFPAYARLAARNEWSSLRELLARSTHFLAVGFTAIAVPTFLLSDVVVSILFERGAFDATARLRTSAPLAMYSLGLVTFAVEAVLVPFYYALKDTWRPVCVGMACVVLDISLAAWLVGPLGVAGVALALTLAKSVKVVVLVVLLARKELFVISWAALAASALRLLIAATAAAVAVKVLLLTWPPPLVGTGLPVKLFWLTTGGALGVGCCLVVLLSIGRKERDLVQESLRALGTLIRGSRRR